MGKIRPAGYKRRGRRRVEQLREIDWALVDPWPVAMGTPFRRNAAKVGTDQWRERIIETAPWKALGICRATYRRLQGIKRKALGLPPLEVRKRSPKRKLVPRMRPPLSPES